MVAAGHMVIASDKNRLKGFDLGNDFDWEVCASRYARQGSLSADQILLYRTGVSRALIQRLCVIGMVRIAMCDRWRRSCIGILVADRQCMCE
jgi:hypothetical protein